MSDVVALYDVLGDSYITDMYEGNQWASYVDLREKKAVLSFWNLSKEEVCGEHILDLGMGPGRWSKFFVDLGFQAVYGLDVSSVMVNVAKKRIQKRNFTAQKGTMEKIPFRSHKFDKIFCFRAFKYVDQPEDVFFEVTRVLKSDGAFLLETSNETLPVILASILAKVVLWLNPKIGLESRWRYFLRARFYSPKEVEEMALKRGLRIIKREPLFLLPSIPLPSSGVIIFAYRAIDNFFLQILPKRLFARSFLFLMIKN